MMKFRLVFAGLIALLAFAVGCRHKIESKVEIPKLAPNQAVVQRESFDRYDLKNQVIQKLASGQDLLWGGFSALRFIEQDSNGHLLFWTLTDRGPNGAEINRGDHIERVFLSPDFKPSLVKLRLNKMDRSLEVIETIPFKNSSGEFMNGLPPASFGGRQFEIATDVRGQPIMNNGLGIDSESLAIDEQNHFWVGEEYWPSVLEFDAQGTLLSHIKPALDMRKKLRKNEIPFEYRFRRSNRGFEAIACFKNRIYFMPQSPFDLDTKPQFIRIGVFNTQTRLYEAEYLYPVENKKVEKIGDMQMLDEKHFLVIEQNGEVGPKGVHRIYKVDLSDATNVLKAHFNSAPELTAAYAFPKNFKFATRSLALDLVKAGYSEFEKVEGLTLIDENTIAVINDNDFGVDGNVIAPRPTALGLLSLQTK